MFNAPVFLRAIQPPLANKIFQNIFLSYHTLSHFFGCQQLLPSDAAALPSTSTPGSCCSHIRKESFIVLCKAARYSYMTKSPNCALGRAATPLVLSSSWLMNRVIPGYPNIWKRHFQKQQTSAVKCSCKSGRWSRFLCTSVFSPSWQENLSAAYKTQAADNLTKAELRPLFLQTLTPSQNHTELQNRVSWKRPQRLSPDFDHHFVI